MSERATVGSRIRAVVEQLVEERLHGVPSWVVLTQLFIGLGWMRAVAEKVINPQWWSGDVIRDFLSDHEAVTLAWYEPFANGVLRPSAATVAVVVVVAQVVAGLSLTTGRRLTTGLTFGIFLNLNFMAAGAVTPSAFYLLAQGALALWLCEASARPHFRRMASISALAFVLVLSNLPFISTLHPEEVIHDPAMMFVFGGSLTFLAVQQASRNRPTAEAVAESASPAECSGPTSLGAKLAAEELAFEWPSEVPTSWPSSGEVMAVA